MNKVFITTAPFAVYDKEPLKLLKDSKIDYELNQLDRKLTEIELIESIKEATVLIAGTETISAKVMNEAKDLKLISRVGVGLNSVDLKAAKERNISVSYTPEAPAPAVAELTIGLTLSLLRMVNVSNLELHEGKWNRFFGRRIPNITVGVIGAGRIGEKVIQHLNALGSKKILVNDLIKKKELIKNYQVEYATKNEIFENADLVTLHLPLTKKTKNLIRKEQLLLMKKDAMIINTSRGGIINEADLYKILVEGHLQGAAVDVFDKEPYSGPLSKVKNCLLTAHMGSMSIDCRSRMELEATEEAIRFLSNRSLKSPVPSYEYDLQM